LAGADNEPPLIFNRIAIGMKFDTDRKRVLLTQADISNGEIGIAGTGSIDYSGEARLQLGFAGTLMSASALKRMWPILIVPEVPGRAGKPYPSGLKFRVDCLVPAAAEILATARINDLSGTLIDPNTNKGTIAANITLAMPVKGSMTKADTTYRVTADLAGFAA